MTVNQGIFADGANTSDRFIDDYERLAIMVKALKDLGTTIVLTSGSFDLVHEGHASYLEVAKSHGGVLIVGVDSDEKIRLRKGENRPIVPEQERLRMLTHLRSVDIVTLKGANDPKWELIRIVHPNVLIVTEGSYSNDKIIELESGYCDSVVMLPRMATTSTTERVRRFQIDLGDRLASILPEAINEIIRQVTESG